MTPRQIAAVLKLDEEDPTRPVPVGDRPAPVRSGSRAQRRAGTKSKKRVRRVI